MHSALRNQRTSPLLKLPGEIRNQIYGYVLGAPTLCVDDRIDRHKKQGAEGSVYWIFKRCKETHSGHYNPRWSFGPPVLGVSRQIHSETWSLLYSSGTFVVDNPGKFFKWINSLPDVARLAVASVSLGEVTLNGKVDGTSVELNVPNDMYPRTSFPPLDLHQIPWTANTWERTMSTSVGDLYWKLPGLKHLRTTVTMKYGRYTRPNAPYLRVDDPDIEAKVRAIVADVFALPNVHVGLDVVLLYKK